MTTCSRWLALAMALMLLPSVASATIDWVTVDDPGNACDQHATGCFGSVTETYRIAEHEVTNAQYSQFLNAVAGSDANTLYNPNMAGVVGGITQSGASPAFSYSLIAGREHMPVNHVSFYDSLRFVNWLHNGRPTGPQDTSTTEDGAYDMSLGSSVVRKAGAQVFLPSEDEWHKAAFYDTGSQSYFRYPAGSDVQIVCATPDVTPNTANCLGGVGDLTDVGSYPGSPSPNGTLDQGGNVSEWSETIAGSERILRNGSYQDNPVVLAAAQRLGVTPTVELTIIGFRVASPVVGAAVPSLGLVPIVVLAALLMLLGGACLRREQRAIYL